MDKNLLKINKLFKKNKRNYIKIDIKRNEDRIKEDDYNEWYRNEEKENIVSKEIGADVMYFEFTKSFYKFKN